MAHPAKKAQRPRELNTHLLPPQARHLVRVMGVGPALRLLEVRGGTRIIVPVRVSADHWLMDVVGLEAFAALVDDSRGLVIELPKYDAVLRQWRHQQVHELSRHLSDGEVARRTGYSRRHVINIRQAEAEAMAMQGDLFGPDPHKADRLAREAEEAETGPTAHDPFGLAPRTGRQTV